MYLLTSFQEHKTFSYLINIFLQKYFASGPGSGDISSLVLEWTNQHGCGKDDKKNNRKVNCDFIIQYRVDNELRDGINTQTQDFTDNKANGMFSLFVVFESYCPELK